MYVGIQEWSCNNGLLPISIILNILGYLSLKNLAFLVVEKLHSLGICGGNGWIYNRGVQLFPSSVHHFLHSEFYG